APANPLGTTNPAMILDNQTLGYAPKGDLLWGIGYNPTENVLYYAVWMENYTSGTPTGRNIIRAIKLTATGGFDLPTDAPQIAMSNYTSLDNYSNPIADIEFSTS